MWFERPRSASYPGRLGPGGVDLVAGEFWSYPQSRAFAELLIDCEEDRTLRAVLVGMLREGQALGELEARAARRGGRLGGDGVRWRGPLPPLGVPEKCIGVM